MLGHHETVKLLAEKGATMLTDNVNLTNGLGKNKLILVFFFVQRDFFFRLFMFTSRLHLESSRSGEKYHSSWR